MIHGSLKYFVIYYFNKRKHWDLSHGLYGHARPGACFSSWDILYLAFEALGFVCLVGWFCFTSFTVLRSFKPQASYAPALSNIPYPTPTLALCICNLCLSIRSQVKYHLFMVSLFLPNVDEVSLIYDYISLEIFFTNLHSVLTNLWCKYLSV